MRRTQLYLEEKDYARLMAASRSTGRTMSDLIRAAVRRAYEGGMSPEERLALLRSAFGVWKDRTPSEEKFIRKLRKGTRIRDLWK
jgi:hypothetical protein